MKIEVQEQAAKALQAEEPWVSFTYEGRKMTPKHGGGEALCDMWDVRPKDNPYGVFGKMGMPVANLLGSYQLAKSEFRQMCEAIRQKVDELTAAATS